MKVLLLAAVLLAPVSTLAAQTPAPPAAPAYKRDVPADLVPKAKITEDSAVALALAKVPGGQVSQLALEREGGKLIYSLDVRIPGKKGIEEVHVDALTGKVLEVAHEED